MKQLRIPETTSKRKTALLVLAAILLFAATTASSQTYSDLYNFGTNTRDPRNPGCPGDFAQGRDRNLYSTSKAGGIGYGIVFQLTPPGKGKVQYKFPARGGPQGSL